MSGSFCVVKASWGTKRTCQSCGARFYDLNKGPIKCPKCGREHDREDFVKVRRGRGAAAAAAAATAATAAAAAATAATAAAAAAAAKAAASKKKSDDASLAADSMPDVEDDDALEDTDDLADEAEDLDVEVEDDKGEGDR
ncbi:MAG: TIGR02300 family protein [Alphaproteobacteria bacterium]|nr:TIGR02300 family protein [Alphaproteobacteria bacterium]